MRSTSVFICMVLSIFSFGQQTKNERESRIKRKELPSQVLESIDDYLHESKKVRFFSETDTDHQSYEVKLSYKGSFFSIEFDKNGALEDVERTIAFKSLNATLKEKITSHLNFYQKFDIDKTQKQYSSSKTDDRTTIRQALSKDTADTIRYELEIQVKQGGKWVGYEMLFSHSGTFISQRLIIHRSSDFILY